MSKLRLVSPIGDVLVKGKGLAPRQHNIDGLRLGIINNGKPNSDIVLEHAASFLEERYGLVRTVNRRKANQALAADFLDEFADEVDVALVGVGD